MRSSEFMYMNKNVFTFVSNFHKIGIQRLQNVCTFVIRCVQPALFYPQISGSDYGRLAPTADVYNLHVLLTFMGAISTTDTTFGPFSEWDFSPKKTFPWRVFSSQNVDKEKSSGNFTYLRNRAFNYSPLY